MTEIETHPFEPFLPPNAKVLFLGSFPPQEKRWSMKWYYPNWINDFWRIVGLVFFGDRRHFTIEERKTFDLEGIMSFCDSKGIALFDTATQVRRLRDNASDNFLEVVTPTDIPSLLERIPQCTHIATTGEKATTTLALTFSIAVPGVGESGQITLPSGRKVVLYRLPSSSRAYPLPLTEKAAYYSAFFREIGLLG